MNQKELYIQYLEDAPNHAKTGEPMKHWQWRYKKEIDRDFDGSWLETDGCTFLVPSEIELRIKPEPLEWTTFVFNQNGYKYGVAGEHLSKEKLAETLGCDASNILAIHYHEIEPE